MTGISGGLVTHLDLGSNGFCPGTYQARATPTEDSRGIYDMSRTKCTTPGATAERNRRKLLDLTEKIPPLPEIITDLLELTQDGEATPDQIQDLLQNDPVLVGKVLMLVNSPLFALNREITSIREGVVLLGFSPLRSMVLAYSASQSMLADYSCYGHSDRGLWFHSVAVAAAARNLATQIGLNRETQETLFVCGMMHDIGKMLLAPTLNERRISIRLFPGSATDMEYQIAGLNHAEAGALIAAKWNLAQTVQEVVAQHHEDNGGPADYRSHCAILRIANAYAKEVGVGYLPGQAGDVIYDAADLKLLHLREETWDQARSEMAVTVDEAVNTLGQIIA